MSYRIILEPRQDGGYIATVPDLPGCSSEGQSAEEAARKVEQAIESYLSSSESQFSFDDLFDDRPHH